MRRAPVALLALVVAAVTVAGSACSAVDPVALEVDGWQLSTSDFESQLQEFADAYAAATSETQAEQALNGTTAGTWSTTFTSQLLNDQLGLQLARIAVEQRGLEVTDDDRAAARTTLEQNFTGQSGESVLDNLSRDYQDRLVEGIAAQVVLQQALVSAGTSDEALRRLYDAGQGANAQEQACVSHILVVAGAADGTSTPTDAEYEAALETIQGLEADIEDGADFAAVARESSEDPGSASQGGDLGCAPQGAYVEGFDEAVWSQPVGEVGPPVKSVYGYHLVLVRSRGVPSFEDVRDQLARSVEQNPTALIEAELVSAARDVEITVDGRFGSYEPESASIVPPAGPQTEAGASPSVEQLLGGQ